MQKKVGTAFLWGCFTLNIDLKNLAVLQTENNFYSIPVKMIQEIGQRSFWGANLKVYASLKKL